MSRKFVQKNTFIFNGYDDNVKKYSFFNIFHFSGLSDFFLISWLKEVHMKPDAIKKVDDIEKLIYMAILRDILFISNLFPKRSVLYSYGDVASVFIVDRTIKHLYNIVILLSFFVVKKPEKQIDLRQYKKRTDILGYIANCENLVQETTKPALSHLISFFEGIDDYTIKTNSLLPKDDRRKLEDGFISALYLFIHSGNNPDLEEEVLNFHFEHSPLQVSEIPIQNIMGFDKDIVIRDIEVNDKLAKYLSKIISSPIMDTWIHSVIFDNCHITGTFDFSKGMGRVEFRKCEIDSNIKFPRYFHGPVGFHESKIAGKITMYPCSIYLGITIQNCYFLKNSALTMKQVTYIWQGGTLEIKNSVFDGEVKINDADLLYANTLISNLKINGKFSYADLYLNSGALIEKIESNNYANICSKLKNCCYESEYIIRKSEKNTNDIPSMDNKTDWYPPKKAAEYIGRSRAFLAKMRERDKTKTEKDSIPFLGEYKSIVYPKDALDAYVARDYQKLEELRGKYSFSKK